MQIFPGGIRIVSIPGTVGIASLSNTGTVGEPPEGGNGGAGGGIGGLGIGLILLPLALFVALGPMLNESPPPPRNAKLPVPSTETPPHGSVQTASPTLSAFFSPAQVPMIKESATNTAKGRFIVPEKHLSKKVKAE